MIFDRLRKRTSKQIFNTLRTRYGRFSSPICTHDPTEIMVFVTNTCNFKCNTCPFTNESPWSPPADVNPISLKLFKRILDNYRGASVVGLVGGEPLLHPEIDALIHEAASRKMTVNLSTNGSLLTDERILSLLESPLGYINISLDAADAGEFFRLRGGSESMFNTVRKNARRLGDLRRKHNSPVQFFVSFVTDAVNLHRIPDFVDAGREVGADTVFCQSVLSYQCSEVTDGEAILWDTPENRHVVENISQPDDVSVVPPLLVPYDEHEGCRCTRCIHPFKLLAVDGDGNLSPCCVIPPHPRFGNIATDIDAWRSGTALMQFRTEMREDVDSSEEICVQCWERYSLKE